jgi:hypothetical protein
VELDETKFGKRKYNKGKLLIQGICKRGLGIWSGGEN